MISLHVALSKGLLFIRLSECNPVPQAAVDGQWKTLMIGGDKVGAQFVRVLKHCAKRCRPLAGTCCALRRPLLTEDSTPAPRGDGGSGGWV